jgi:hypothetical protein
MLMQSMEAVRAEVYAYVHVYYVHVYYVYILLASCYFCLSVCSKVEAWQTPIDKRITLRIAFSYI